MPKAAPYRLAAEWSPVFEEWQRFTKTAPQLDISASHKALTNFLAAHRDELAHAGAIVKSHKGRWLAHRDLFGPAVFAICIGKDAADAVEKHRAACAA